MKEQTHTPGPWQVNDDTADVMIVGWDIAKDEEIEIAFLTGCGSGKQIEANARLITAAPDLLAAARLALEEMRETVAPRNSFTDAVDALDAAIAKAEAR